MREKYLCLYMPEQVPGPEVFQGPSLQEAHGVEEKPDTKEAVRSGKKSREVIGTYTKCVLTQCF